MGTYTVTISAVTPLGVDTGISFSFDVEFQDPCALATLTIDPATLTANPYTYVIDATADVQTFLDAHVSSSETTAPCPATFTFTVTNRDGSPFDTSLFTWDGAADTFTTFTNTFAYQINSPYELTAHVAYDGGYAIAGTLDFEVVVDISCTSAVFDTFTVADMSHPVFGAADTQTLVAVQDSVSQAVGT